MRDGNACFGNEFGEFGRHTVDARDAVVHEKDLTLAKEFATNRGRNLLLGIRADEREDWVAILGRGGERRHLAYARDCHLERARDGRCAHREDVDVGLEFLQRILVFNTKALLFVDDDETEVFEPHIVTEQPVRADDHVDGSVGEPGESLARFFVCLKSAQCAKVHGEARESFVECLCVLTNEQSRRHEHRDLLTVLDGFERGPHGHLGLAETDVTRNESVHRDGPLHVDLDLINRRQLVGRLGERKRFFKFALPRSVRAKRVALARHACRIQLDKLHGNVTNGATSLRLGLRPVAATHLRQSRFFTADVTCELVELVGRHVQLVAGEATLAWRVLEYEIFAGGARRVAVRRVRHLARDELEKAPDAVGLVHDDVTGLELQRINDVLAAFACELLRRTRIVGRGTPVELALGQKCERGIRHLEPVLEVGLHQIGHALFEGVGQRIHNSTCQRVLGQHLFCTFDQTMASGGDDDRPALTELLAHVFDRAIDVAREARHRVGIDPDVFVVATLERAQRPPRSVGEI